MVTPVFLIIHHLVFYAYVQAEWKRWKVWGDISRRFQCQAAPDLTGSAEEQRLNSEIILILPQQ